VLEEEKLVLPIGGMHCASCALTIEDALQKTEGVIEASVNIATEKAVITYDSSKVGLDEFEDVIRDTGYEPILPRFESEMREVILKIAGMTCASCAATVEKALSSLVGVESASVNIATEKARVMYDPGLLSILDLRQAVVDVGYDVETEEEVDRSVEEMREGRRRMLLSWAFTLPIIVWMLDRSIDRCAQKSLIFFYRIVGSRNIHCFLHNLDTATLMGSTPFLTILCGLSSLIAKATQITNEDPFFIVFFFGNQSNSSNTFLI